MDSVTIRTARSTDHDAVFKIFEPIIREGETYALPKDTARDDAIAYWFDFVVRTNDAAVSLWKKMGFEVVGRSPLAFNHPRLGLVDALVMHGVL